MNIGNDASYGKVLKTRTRVDAGTNQRNISTLADFSAVPSLYCFFHILDEHFAKILLQRCVRKYISSNRTSLKPYLT